MKLKTKIQLFIVVLLLIVSSSEFIIFIKKEEHRLIKIRENICYALINKMESDVKYALTIKNKKFLKVILENYSNINFIENILVYIGDKEFLSLKNNFSLSTRYVEKRFKFINIFKNEGAASLTSFNIRIYYNINDIRQAIKHSINYLIILLLIFITISFIVISFFLERFLSPLENFLETIKETINGNYKLMSTSYKTEFLPVFKAYNQLILNLKDKIISLEEANKELKNRILEIQKLQDMIIRQEKLATLGTISAGIAHEINNPVGAIRGLSELALLLKKEDKYEEYFRKIIAHCDRIKEIVSRVKEVTKEIDSKKMEKVNIKNIINDVIELCKNAKIISNKIKIKGNFNTSNIEIKCIKNQIFQVFQNLITNSADALNGEGEITIDLFEFESNLIITFADTGPGIPEPIREKVFDPFFTTKGPKGTGLGLYIVYGIIKNHGGNIQILPSEKGAKFEITLPLNP